MDKNDSVHPTPDAETRNGDVIYGQPGIDLHHYAAIHLKVTSPDLPDWLNQMIDRSRKDDFARAAMQGLIATHLRGMEITLAIHAKQVANAMMEESK
jgi:hypothetical protein